MFRHLRASALKVVLAILLVLTLLVGTIVATSVRISINPHQQTGRNTVAHTQLAFFDDPFQSIDIHMDGGLLCRFSPRFCSHQVQA